MKLVIESQVVNAALDLLVALVPPSTGVVNFVSIGDKLMLQTFNEGGIARTQIGVAADVKFAVALDALATAVKNRGQLVLAYGAELLAIKAKGFKVELNTVDVIDQVEDELTPEKKWKITPELAEWLRKTAKEVAIKVPTFVQGWVPLGIMLDKRGAFVTCYDNTRISWTADPKVVGDFEMALPTDVMISVLDKFYKQPFVLEEQQGLLVVKNKTTFVRISVPSLQSENLPSIAEVRARCAQLKAEAKASQLVLETEAVQKFLDNSRAVLDKGRAEISVTANGKQAVLSIQTPNGAASTSLTCQGKVEFKIDYEFLSDILTKVGQHVQITIKGPVGAIKTKSGMFVLGLNQ